MVRLKLSETSDVTVLKHLQRDGLPFSAIKERTAFVKSKLASVLRTTKIKGFITMVTEEDKPLYDRRVYYITDKGKRFVKEKLHKNFSERCGG